MIKRVRIAAAAILGFGVLAASSASATTWVIFGQVANCDPFFCQIAHLAVGDPVIGFLSAVDAASGPNSTFDAADITDYAFVAGDIEVSPASGGHLISTPLMTDGNGEIASGSVEISGAFDGGVFGLIPVLITLDATGTTFSIETDFLGIGVFASGPLLFALDSDGDGVANGDDNCPADPNPLQENNDGDSEGDVCDPDDDNDGIGDSLDAQPFTDSNECTGGNDINATLVSIVENDLTCAARETVTVLSGTKVQGLGNLHLIADTVIFQSGVELEKIDVIAEDSCPGCP